MGETRYKSLKAAKPEVAGVLFAKAEKDAAARLESYKIKAEESKEAQANKQ